MDTLCSVAQPAEASGSMAATFSNGGAVDCLLLMLLLLLLLLLELDDSYKLGGELCNNDTRPQIADKAKSTVIARRMCQQNRARMGHIPSCLLTLLAALPLLLPLVSTLFSSASTRESAFSTSLYSLNTTDFFVVAHAMMKRRCGKNCLAAKVK